VNIAEGKEGSSGTTNIYISSRECGRNRNIGTLITRVYLKMYHLPPGAGLLGTNLRKGEFPKVLKEQFFHCVLQTIKDMS